MYLISVQSFRHMRTNILTLHERDEAIANDELNDKQAGFAKVDIAMDKSLLQLIQFACKADKMQRALDLTATLQLTRSIDAAVKIAMFHHLPSLAERMNLVKEVSEERRLRTVACVSYCCFNRLQAHYRKEQEELFASRETTSPSNERMLGSSSIGSNSSRPFVLDRTNTHVFREPVPVTKSPLLSSARRSDDSDTHRSSKRVLDDNDGDGNRSPEDDELPAVARKKMKEAEEKNLNPRTKDAEKTPRVNPFKKNAITPKSNPFAAPNGPTNTISRSNSFFDAIGQVVSDNGEIYLKRFWDRCIVCQFDTIVPVRESLRKSTTGKAGKSSRAADAGEGGGRDDQKKKRIPQQGTLVGFAVKEGGKDSYN
ncbi:hypothetical protein BC936DRAFT_139247 [Jimgerdemannia flammicorona]|uniref:WDHD1/CFT4 helical bundle domain-containing protein n=1 Tax=Jimgerdemannia flammicorona TaxID=994334 RepID=A0A433BAA9_9FUNG|nr:hypothetical protein BC936DRAFT_139247 [Jimgerdemannia flammicorona]